MTDISPVRARCSNCGHVVKKLPLKIREWDCPECSSHHDRDINAAINILRMGTRGVRKTQAVRPRAADRRKGMLTKRGNAHQEGCGTRSVSASRSWGRPPIPRCLVCGATVRPEEIKSRKAGAMKQKAPTSNARESRAVTQVQRREDVNNQSLFT